MSRMHSLVELTFPLRGSNTDNNNNLVLWKHHFYHYMHYWKSKVESFDVSKISWWIKINHTGILICFIEFRSRRVTVEGCLFTVSKSIVTPNGMPISSVRAYLRPIEPAESSTLWLMSYLLRPLAESEKTLANEVGSTYRIRVIHCNQV